MTINFEEYQEAHDQLKKFIHDKFIEKYKSCFTEDEYTCFTLSFEDFQAYLNSQPVHLIERDFQYVLPSVLRSLYEEGYEIEFREVSGIYFIAMKEITSNLRKSISDLARLLTDARIPYQRSSVDDGEQLRVMSAEDCRECLVDAICTRYSYGHEYGLLEICGGLTEEEFKENDVKGRLTPEEVAKRFIYCYKNNTDTYEEE